MKRLLTALFAVFVGLTIAMAPVPALADLISPEEWDTEAKEEQDVGLVDEEQDADEESARNDVAYAVDTGESSATSYLPIAVGVAVVSVGAAAGVVMLKRRPA